MDKQCLGGCGRNAEPDGEYCGNDCEISHLREVRYELLADLRELAAIGEAGVIERRETGKPTWSALTAVKDIARAAIAKANGDA